MKILRACSFNTVPGKMTNRIFLPVIYIRLEMSCLEVESASERLANGLPKYEGILNNGEISVLTRNLKKLTFPK